MASGGSWWQSLGWASLPSLDSFTTQHWQRRLLRYLIKRTLAGFLRVPEDDIDKSTYLEADLGSGSLKLRDVELDQDAINTIIKDQLGSEPQVELSLLSSRLANVQVLVGSSDTAGNDSGKPTDTYRPVSATDRLFKAPIHILASDIVLDFRIDPINCMKEETEGLQDQDVPTDHTLDLNASILHVAEDYIHEDGTELEESAEVDDEPFGLPGGFERASNSTHLPRQPLTEQQQVGLIASIIETLVKRVRISVANVTINIAFSDDFRLQLRIIKVDSFSEQHTSQNSESQSRVLEILGLDLYYASYLQKASVRCGSKDTDADRTGSPSSASTGSSDDLAMSMAIADLRESSTLAPPLADPAAGMSSATADSSNLDRSVYLDAEEDDEPVEQEDNLASHQCEDVHKREEPREVEESEPSAGFRHISGLFSNQGGSRNAAKITMRYTSISKDSVSRETPTVSVANVSKRLGIVVPMIALSLDAQIIRSATDFAVRLPERGCAAGRKVTRSAHTSNQRATLIHLRGHAIHLFAHSQSSDTDLLGLAEAAASVCPKLNCGSMYLFLDAIEAAYRPDSADGKVAVYDWGIAFGREKGLQPLLLPDPGIIWQYDPDTLRPGGSGIQVSDWSAQPSCRLQDWRTGLPVGASSISASTSLPMLKDALAIRLAGSNIKISSQPLHVWLDVEALDQLAECWMQSELGGLQIGESKSNHAEPRRASSLDSQNASLNISFTLPCIWCELKCPTLQSPEESVYGPLRSGLVAFSLHDLQCRFTSNVAETQNQALEFPEVSVENAFMFLTGQAEDRLRPVLWVGHGGPSKPVGLAVYTGSNASSSTAQLGVRVQIPAMEATLEKTDIDNIQYLVDDVTRAAGRVASVMRSNSARPADSQGVYAGAARIPSASSEIKSRVSSNSASAQNNASFVEADILVQCCKLRLNLPCDDKVVEHCLQAAGQAVSVCAGLKKNDEDDFVLDVRFGDLHVTEIVGRASQHSTRVLVQRRESSHTPCIRLSLVSRVDAQFLKHSKLSIQLHAISFNLSSDAAIFGDLATLLKAPDGAFLDVVPTESTRIYVNVTQSLLRLLPLTLPSSLALKVGGMKLSTQLKRHGVVTRYDLQGNDISLWAADVRRDPDVAQFQLRDLGYAQLLQCQGIRSRIKSQTAPSVSTNVTLSLRGAHVTVCPDTILCIANIAGDVSSTSTAEAKSSHGSNSSISGSIILPREPFSQEQPGSEAPFLTPVSVVDDEVIQINGTSRMDVVPDWYSAPRSHTEQASLPSSPTLALRLLPSDVTISFYEGYDYERTRSYIKSTVKATRKKLEKIKQLLAEGQMPEQTLEEVADPLLQSVFLPSKPRKSTLNAQSESVINTLTEENDAMTRIVAFDDELDQGDDISDEALFNWENIPDRPPAPRRGSSSSSRTPIPRIDGSPNRLRRPRTSAIDVQLAEVSVSYKSYPVAVPLASRLLVNLGDLAVFDNMKTSTWNKFLTELRPRDGGITRPTGAPMVRVMLKMLRAGESSDGTEADLAVKVAPLRLHIDQDALDFFKAFFAFKLEPPAVLSDSPPTLSPANKAERTNSSKGFVQRVEIAAIKIKLDYKPKRVDYLALRQGKTIEMMNFFHFEASEMVLRHLVLSGIPSWAKVGDMLQEIWTPDVKANQLADFLAGINPVRSVVNVGHGVADLVLLPVAQYRKDGRLARGLQRGGTKFAKSTAMEAIKLGARLATGTQVILEHAEHVLGGRIDGLPTNTSSGARSSTPTADQQARSEWLLTATESSDEEDEIQMPAEPVSSKFSQQPEDVRVGLQTAYRSLSGNVRSAAETILAVPMEVYERSSEGPVRAVVRAVPIAVLKPMIGASEAVSKTLLGLRNTLDPGAKEEIQDKYKRRSNTG